MLTVHRWLSLGAAAFWLLQAFTGILIVFHWEITDAALSDIHRPTDLAAIERRIDTLAPACRRSEEHTSELQSLMRISYAVFCLQKKKTSHIQIYKYTTIILHINIMTK